MERSENEIVAAPPFSTVQVKPPRFFGADALKSLGITGVQIRAVCPVGVDDISAAVQKFEPIS